MEDYASLARPLPPHLAPPELWPEYGAIAIPRTVCAREEIHANVPGVRWGLWPLYFEEYLGDEEPDLRPGMHGALAYNRMISWKRLRRTDIPKGWFLLSRRSWRIDAYRELPEGEHHTAQWNKNSRYNLRAWQELERSGRFRIEEVALDEFMQAYRGSTVDSKVGMHLAEILERKYAMPAVAPHLSLWGVRDTQSGALIAGTGAAHSPTYRASIREASFITDAAKHIHASTALMDRWMGEAAAKGAASLFFTHFWQRGEPRNWKGFSAFKSHFGHLHYISYPPILWKFRGGKFF